MSDPVEYVRRAQESLRKAKETEECGVCREILDEFVDQMELYARVHESVLLLSSRQESLREDLQNGAREAGISYSPKSITVAEGWLGFFQNRLRLRDILPGSRSGP